MLRPLGRRRRTTVEVERSRLDRLTEGDDCDRLEEALRPGGFRLLDDHHACAATGIELAELPGVYERLVADQRWVQVPGTNVWCVPAVREAVEERLVRRLERFHRANPLEPGRQISAVLGWLERGCDRAVAKSLLDEMVARGKLKQIGKYLCLPAFAPTLSRADEALLADMVRRIGEGRFKPPSLDRLVSPPKVDRKRLDRLARLAVATGQLVPVSSDIYLSEECEQQLRRVVTDLIEKNEAVTVAELREALGSSRKYCVPLMEYLDRIGFTQRIGDRRVLNSGP